MRIKQLWDVVPLPSKLKLAYSLVTFNLPTTVFFLLSLLQCILQSGFHGWSALHHHSFTLQIKEIALNPRIISHPLVVLSDDQFFLCDSIPSFAGGPGKCTRAVFNAQSPSFNATVTLNGSSALMQTLANHTQPGTLRSAAHQCAEVSPWVYQELRAANREDIVFVVYQIWLLCISLSAVLSQSIPHLMAALASETLASVSTAIRIAGTSSFEAKFGQSVTNNACHGIDLLRGYFAPRHTAELIICVVDCTMLVVLAGLSYHLVQIYGRNSFEKVQRRPDMSRLYIALLSLSSSVQLAAFFMVASLGVLTDQLVFGPLRDLALDKTQTIVIHVVTYVLVPPWIFLGWTCGCVESKRRVAAFIAITVAFLVQWASSFTCSTNRFVFLTWDFFAALTIASGVFMLCILLLAIFIWFHLDLGLAAFLKCAELPHPAEQVRWSFASMPDTEKGSSPPSADKSTKHLAIWYHPPLPIFPPAVGVRSSSPSNCSISTESDKQSDNIKTSKSCSISLESSSSSEITTPRRGRPAINLEMFPTAQHATLPREIDSPTMWWYL